MIKGKNKTDGVQYGRKASGTDPAHLSGRYRKS